MAIWSKDERFLISFFHESLIGPALEWYIQLDHSKIVCWRDLADLFMNQYRFNLDTAPTREQLGTLQKKSGESFKQYAQRWRTLAAQVQPPLTLSEMCSYFLGTLGSPYIGAMAGAVYRDFADLIAAGERIEILTKAGKLPVNITESNLKKGFPPKKKEPEVSYVQDRKPSQPRYPPSYPIYQAPPPHSLNPHPQYHTPTPSYSSHQTPQINSIPTPHPYVPNRPTYTNYPPRPQNHPSYSQPRPNTQNQGRFRPQNLPPFPRLAISNADLFQRLHDAHIISEVPVRPMEPPFPAWYNPSLTCKYHMGATGHSIEDCEAFKTAVRKLIAYGKLDIQEETGPSIVNNPIPNHAGRNHINALNTEGSLIRKVIDLCTPMIEVFGGLK